MSYEKLKKYSVNVEKQDIKNAKEAEGELLLEDLPKEEIEKTQEDIRLIKKASMIVSETLKKLGFDNDFSIDPDLVLIAKSGKIETAQIDNKEKKKYLLDERAFHKTVGGNVVVSEQVLEDRQRFFHILLHEFFHSAGVNYGFLTKENEVVDRRLVLKSGYKTFYDSQEEERSVFTAFNEAITEELARESARMFFDDSFSYEDIDSMFKEWNEIYPIERSVLYAIILELSGGDEEKINEVWKDIISGYLKGTKMHLRDIEKHFGKGSLKILSQMTTNPKDLKKNLEISNFFSEQDAKKRDELRKSILAKM